MNAVRVRYPPSPTGFCHVGTARMALLNYLFAKKHAGAIVFRIEDTDKERSYKEYEEDIIESFRWLGLTWDEFYRQSERSPVYREALARLIASDKAYVSEEESKKEPGTRVRIVRLRNAGRSVTFRDIIRGDITFDTKELGDFAIARSEEDPLYHFSVVVDDAAMGITHVIRGEDHISNTPRQILIQEALGLPRPEYAHYPLNLSTDRSKLSKRKGDVAVRDFRARGYLSEALINYLGIVGWTPPSGREILSLPEMVAEFKLEDVGKSGGVFDVEKLRWYNRQYLEKLTLEQFIAGALLVLKSAIEKRSFPWDESLARRITPILRERISVWEDIRALAEDGEFDYFFIEPTFDPAKLPGKGSDAKEASLHLARIHEALSKLPKETFDEPETIKNAVWEYATSEGRGAVLWPLRYALSGKERSPDPFTISSIVGKDATLARIVRARMMLEEV